MKYLQGTALFVAAVAVLYMRRDVFPAAAYDRQIAQLASKGN